MPARPRVLLAITVYNGRLIVPRCLDSAARIATDTVDVDVLVLDDASPDPGFSQLVEAQCAALGFGYYRTPRNLGIVRNVNLGLLRARSAGYDGVIISNSDVLYSRAFVDRLWAVAESDPTIGSVTAWSTNVSAYSIPNSDPDEHLADQEVVDDVAETLWQQFGTTAVDIPAGISFAMLIKRKAVVDVGLMDPVFGRGYCEETDWSRRSLAAGFRLILAPGAFVYHAGGGSTEAAGMISAGHTTVPENEAVIDLRYPEFRAEVGAFVTSGPLHSLWETATSALVASQITRGGYELDLSVYDRQEPVDGNRARVELGPAGPVVTASARGFSHRSVLPGADLPAELRAVFGALPRRARVYDQTLAARQAGQALVDAGVPVVDHRSYPETV
jgi:GT2 family glycosyltransferase